VFGLGRPGCPRFLALNPFTGTGELSEFRDRSLDLRALMTRVSSAVESDRATFPETWDGHA
jgi:seryl-tRNA synthetase